MRWSSFIYVHMPKRQHYGIEFPITIISDERTLFDLCTSRADMAKSAITHCLFTPKGQRLRSPNFGSRLIQFIFNPSDNDSWGDVVAEVKDMINSWVPYCNLQDIQVVETDNGLGLRVVVKFTVQEEDGSVGEYEFSTNI